MTYPLCKSKSNNQGHEILLDHQGVCNLTTLNLAAFVKDGEWNTPEIISSMRLITRMGSRITLVDMWDSEWDYVQKRDRLLGVSLTGIVEAYNSLSVQNQNNFAMFLDRLRYEARLEANCYHEQLGIQRSLLVTTVKPEGTISQLPTVSSGVHAPYAPYYKRRIRVSSTDPIAKALRDLDLIPVPENGQGSDLYAPEDQYYDLDIDEDKLISLISFYETAYEDYELDASCGVGNGSACPIR